MKLNDVEINIFFNNSIMDEFNVKKSLNKQTQIHGNLNYFHIILSDNDSKNAWSIFVNCLK